MSTSLLVSYPSSSEESEDNNEIIDSPGRKRKQVPPTTAVDNETEAKRPKPALPLPESIRRLGGDKGTNDKDDSSVHGGRIRSFPHEEGNWATLVYISYDPEEEFFHLQKELFLCLRPLEFQPMTDYHVSLSRTVTIRHHWIQTLIDSLRKGLGKIESCGLEFDGVKVYTNDEKTRSFLALDVSSGSDILQQYVNVVDECFHEYKLQKYYEPASFHVSIGWCLGDITAEVDKNTKIKLKMILDKCLKDEPELQFFFADTPASFHVSIGWCLGDITAEVDKNTKIKLKMILDKCLKDEPELQFFFADTVRCKTGNKEFQFPLADT